LCLLQEQRLLGLNSLARREEPNSLLPLRRREVASDASMNIVSQLAQVARRLRGGGIA
jgi:hypothetical protein